MSAIKLDDSHFELDYLKNEIMTKCAKHNLSVQFSRGRNYDRYAFAQGVAVKVDRYGITIERDSSSIRYFSTPNENYSEAIETVEVLLK